LGAFLKPLRLNKVIGLSVGEKSLLAAEVVTGDKPEVKRLAEFVYPDGISPANPVELGTALGEFLKQKDFTAKSAVVGLPARWLVVKSKDVPPADPTTLANLLRLQAEGEFSTELKDLVYDYAADLSAGNPKSVLLIATSKKYVDGASAMCEAAKLNAVIVTSSAVALGSVTGRSIQAKNPLVLLVSPAGAELTSQSGNTPSAIRHLRGPGPDRPFVGELRRAISGMPASSNGINGAGRELVLWDAAGGSAFDSGTLGESLGLTVRNGDLPIFGVSATEAASNGEGRKFAAAVALALLGVGETTRSIDFLHSQLAPVEPPRIPRWVSISSLAAIAVLALVFLAYTTLQNRQAKLDKINDQLNSVKDDVTTANEFVTKVSFAQYWHMGDPRYIACLADLTKAIPQDNQTYALSLILKEDAPAPGNSTATSLQAHAPLVRTLTGRLDGKTNNQRNAQQVAEQLKLMPKSFKDVKTPGTSISGRGGEVSFSVTFTYVPPTGKH
jgi:hypothetical protein